MVATVAVSITTNIIILWFVWRMRHLQCSLLTQTIMHSCCWWTTICSVTRLSIMLFIMIVMCIKCIIRIWWVLFPSWIWYQLFMVEKREEKKEKRILLKIYQFNIFFVLSLFNLRAFVCGWMKSSLQFLNRIIWDMNYILNYGKVVTWYVSIMY